MIDVDFSINMFSLIKHIYMFAHIHILYIYICTYTHTVSSHFIYRYTEDNLDQQEKAIQMISNGLSISVTQHSQLHSGVKGFLMCLRGSGLSVALINTGSSVREKCSCLCRVTQAGQQCRWLLSNDRAR